MPDRQFRYPQPTWIEAAIESGQPLHYARCDARFHNALNLGLLVTLLAGALSLCVVGAWLQSVAFIPLASFGFGLIYFSLFILVVHEASHNMFINLGPPGRSREWNRRLGWMVCIPFGVEYIKHWEVGHSIHHRNPVDPNDPQNCPQTIYSGSILLAYLAKVLFVPGYAILRLGATCPAERYEPNWALSMSSAAVWVCALTFQIVVFHWTVAVASLLGLHVLVALNAIKISMEHGGAIGRRENPMMRSSSSLFPLRWLLMPFNISLHFEHHLNCSVPWYLLSKYHQTVSNLVPKAREADVYKDRSDVWKQIAR